MSHNGLNPRAKIFIRKRVNLFRTLGLFSSTSTPFWCALDSRTEGIFFRIVDGVPKNIDHYGLRLRLFLSCFTNGLPGLELARLADLPSDVITEAHRVATILAETETRNQERSQTTKIAIRRKALLRVLKLLFEGINIWPVPFAHSPFAPFW